MKISGVTIGVIAFFQILLESQALRCYVCNSGYDLHCGSNSPPLKYLVDCSDETAVRSFSADNNHSEESIVGSGSNSSAPHEGLNYTTCIKQLAILPEQNNGKEHSKPGTTRTIRSCGWLNRTRTQTQCQLVSNDKLWNEHCWCSKDACNFGESLKNGGTPFAIALFILVTCIFSG